MAEINIQIQDEHLQAVAYNIGLFFPDINKLSTDELINAIRDRILNNFIKYNQILIDNDSEIIQKKQELDNLVNSKRVELSTALLSNAKVSMKNDNQ